ncbi:MAG TPA: hypothetical protein P5527_13375, partial [Kiritimatiellia bacterium]|nr:hypothetical protein [Kiritimatiellia bacterium]
MTRRIVIHTLIVAMAAGTVTAAPQPGAVADALAVPVLVTTGLVSHEAVFSQVLAADEAADRAWGTLTTKEALAAHQKQ